jgi:DNA-binding NtrC family response regulator
MKKEKPQALIVDSDSGHTQSLRSLLESTGFQVQVSDDVIDAASKPCLVFISMDLPGLDQERLVAAPELGDCVEIVLMAEEDDPQRVRKCIAEGATYFFCKPFDPEFLGQLITDVFTEVNETRSKPGARSVEPLDQFGLMRGSSTPMRKLYRVLRKVAPTRTSVLLVGESGTGKELAANTLHQMSEVANGPFVAVNCAAIPKELFESELFGHEKGSFSGAGQQHRGLFERAEGGTLFLDELVEMPVELQVKLLRALEAGAFRRVGGERDIRSNVRIIAATNKEPDLAISEGLLREDLYYRIARFPIGLPPLRSRAGDILGLAHFFLDALNEEHGTNVGIDPAAEAEIERHSWPGNVRELRSVIERAYILTNAVIGKEHLPRLEDNLNPDQLRISVGESIEDAERKLIFATLEAHDENKSEAAQTLGVSLKTLYNRLNKYESDDE